MPLVASEGLGFEGTGGGRGERHGVPVARGEARGRGREAEGEGAWIHTGVSFLLLILFKNIFY